MNFSIPHCFSAFRTRRRARVFTAVALITFLFTVTSVQAGPVRINQVVQTLTSNQGPTDLKVGIATQDPIGGSKVTTPGAPKSDGPIISGDAPKLDGLLSGMSLAQDPLTSGVEIIEEAEVEGTICDCGDILLPGGGFPKWPLLLLAAVPLAFINHCDSCDQPPPSTPTPTPPNNQTPTPTPEPASLFLLGTGLLAVGAGLRRRRRIKT
jgi:hypothetical protein